MSNISKSSSAWRAYAEATKEEIKEEKEMKGRYLCFRVGRYVETPYVQGMAGAGEPCHPECKEANRLHSIAANETESHRSHINCPGRHVEEAWRQARAAIALVEGG